MKELQIKKNENQILAQDLKEASTRVEIIKEKSDGLKEHNRKLQKELQIKKNENQILAQDLKEASTRVEMLHQEIFYVGAKEIEKVKLVKKIVCSKKVSIFHCKDCKEKGNDYIYCPQSIINISDKKEKEEKIKEYQGLFETYQKQEEERNEEPIFDEEIFNQILAKLDITYNSEKVEMEK
ncbi:hypothetical protein Glove_50g22 [Diversispora epigaea]|uniref:Uncharacterized protein n=1 Tax=Diversispora epigaea TaxID=1348612 RepID=A0A397JDS9_9GLOM|nr:hypothetical protein Glove_50g22 [Diversispora epigaea]